MGNMENSQGVSFGGKRRANGWLVGVFVALVVVIVGLSVSLVVVFLSSNDKRDQSESMHTSKLEEINEIARELTEEDAKKLYEETIEQEITDVGRAQARIEYGRYLLSKGQAGEMLLQFEQVDDAILDAGYKILLYSALREYYKNMGDIITSDEYNEKIGEVVSNSRYAAGG